jgi:hypothetical protein
MVSMNIAVLIGAGASYGAGGIGPERPPLGGELFDRLRRAFPASWGELLADDEIDAFMGDPPFERGMKMLWEMGDRRAQRLIIDMALYFARFRPDMSRNHYAALIRMLVLSGSGLAFCSLNYECVFEQVMAHLGYGLMNLGPPDRLPSFLLQKPHGSCNYIDPMTRNVTNTTFAGPATYVYREAPSPNDVEVVPCAEVAEIYDAVGLSIPPAMSLYEPRKHSPVNPSLFEMVRTAWQGNALAADVILTVGARPVFEDHHIWDAVISASSPVWFVGGQDAVFQELRSRMGGRLVPIADTFDAALPVLYRRLPAALRV